MLYLLGGLAVLSGFLLLVYLLVNADPARLARGLKVTGICLGIADLLALLRQCRAEDEEGARLLEAYLDRLHPDWRDEFSGERTGSSGSSARTTSGDMTIDEAYAILGLAPGADAEAIKEAHRRLMVKLHPDHGGSDYLATKINRARDVLLHH